MGRAEAIQTEVVHFQHYNCLSLSIFSVGTWEKSGLLTLKMTLTTYSTAKAFQSLFSSYVFWGLGREVFTKHRFGRAQKSSVTADLAILA